MIKLIIEFTDNNCHIVPDAKAVEYAEMTCGAFKNAVEKGEIKGDVVHKVGTSFMVDSFLLMITTSAIPHTKLGFRSKEKDYVINEYAVIENLPPNLLTEQTEICRKLINYRKTKEVEVKQ